MDDSDIEIGLQQSEVFPERRYFANYRKDKPFSPDPLSTSPRPALAFGKGRAAGGM